MPRPPHAGACSELIPGWWVPGPARTACPGGRRGCSARRKSSDGLAFRPGSPRADRVPAALDAIAADQLGSGGLGRGRRIAQRRSRARPGSRLGHAGAGRSGLFAPPCSVTYLPVGLQQFQAVSDEDVGDTAALGGHDQRDPQQRGLPVASGPTWPGPGTSPRSARRMRHVSRVRAISFAQAPAGGCEPCQPAQQGRTTSAQMSASRPGRARRALARRLPAKPPGRRQAAARSRQSGTVSAPLAARVPATCSPAAPAARRAR